MGSRDEAGAWCLWLSLPEELREKALVFTDGLAAYEAIFAPGQHQVRRKKTNHPDRTPEQYPAATLRKVKYGKNLAFSKTWKNHWLAIRYFLYHYNLDKLTKNTSLF
ncbi:hypothetical protein AAG747_19245 [Rapidithrix thailandica]|uniref:Transposase n=1 Tax=Rapidithrix thailandica TaxID=413964 RepID=A0AAW9S1T3_9BACT